MRNKFLVVIMILVLMVGLVGCLGIIDVEVANVSIGIAKLGRMDSKGRVEYMVTLKNNSKKTLVQGNYMIYSKDISGALLTSDAVYPKDVKPGATRTATVWMKMPPGAEVCGKWLSVKYK